MLGCLTFALAFAQTSTIEVPRHVYEALLDEVGDARPEQPGPAPAVTRRIVELGLERERVELRATWSIDVVRPGWVRLPVLPAGWRLRSVRLEGRPIELGVTTDRHELVRFLERGATLEVRAERDGDARKGIPIDLLPAATGTVTVRSSDPVVRLVSEGGAVARVGETFWTAAGRLQVSTSEARPAARSGAQMVGRVGRGVTVGDAAVTHQARVEYLITRGSFERVAFELPVRAPDLAVAGPSVRRWTRNGNRIVVELERPEEALVELSVRWSEPLPDRDEVAVDVVPLKPVDTYRVERSLQLAREGDREILPTMAGWTGIASAELPEVGRGLVTGTPTSAWVAATSRPARLSLLRFQPVSGPATLVDVAAVSGVLSRDGRVLYRAHYTVRNDRGDFLRIRLGDGQRLISATVGGEPARVARDGELYLVPLLKSVETVQGLLDFPVKLVVIGDGIPLERRADRPVPIPVVDAPVAVTRVELALPEGWENELEEGEAHVVDAFSEGDGITYGFKSGDSNVARADALYQDALRSWMSNDFDKAQEALDDLTDLGASNENIGRLQSNLDVVFGGQDDAGSALSRRVKDQARARAFDEEQKQKELEEEADEALATGDYEAAEAAYREALDIGATLQRLEQTESREMQSQNLVIETKLSKARSIKAKKGRSKRDTSVTTSEVVVLDFEADEISGELEAPAPEFQRNDGFLAGGQTPEGSVDPPPAVVEELLRVAEASDRRWEAQRRREAEEARRLAEERRRREAEESARHAAAAARKAAEEDRRRYGEEARRRYEQERLADAPPIAADEAKRSGGRAKPKRSRASTEPSFQFARKKALPPPAPPPRPEEVAADPFNGVKDGVIGGALSARAPEPVVVASDRFDALDITASDLDVVLPQAGEIVRYQHLILPAGATAEVVVRAKAQRGIR